jgi:plastocyanin
VKRALVGAAVTCALIAAPGARADTHQVTVGNFYFEDDQQRDRTKLVVDVGDQITFTVRQASYPPHTIDVDELDIHSDDLFVGQTYTTPPLRRPGNFYLYCRPHEARGHHTRLIVRAAAPATPKATARATTAPARSAAPAPATTATGGTPTPTPSAASSSTPALAPVGVGTAAPGSLTRTLEPDPDSLEALTGVQRSNEIPWTRAVWWLLLASVPIVATAAFALRRNATLRALELRAASQRAAADAERAQSRRGSKKPARGRKRST